MIRCFLDWHLNRRSIYDVCFHGFNPSELECWFFLFFDRDHIDTLSM